MKARASSLCPLRRPLTPQRSRHHSRRCRQSLRHHSCRWSLTASPLAQLPPPAPTSTQLSPRARDPEPLPSGMLWSQPPLAPPTVSASRQTCFQGEALASSPAQTAPAGSLAPSAGGAPPRFAGRLKCSRASQARSKRSKALDGEGLFGVEDCGLEVSPQLGPLGLPALCTDRHTKRQRYPPSTSSSLHSPQSLSRVYTSEPASL